LQITVLCDNIGVSAWRGRDDGGLVERVLVMTGIGGQGIQLGAQVVARAALAEGREVQLFGSYGGMMRGGNTEATLVVADGPIEAPPTVSEAWSAILMHHDYSEATVACLRPGSVVFVNSTVFEASLERDPYVVIDVPATEIAIEVGNIVAASMVMVGAYSGATGLVGLDALTEAVAEALPAYRSRHIELNVAALRAGHGAVDGLVAPAWAPVPA
jgi:Pyruvate/2-oxoacid:ferredoxin oxidoreductase gamma subunit